MGKNKPLVKKLWEKPANLVAKQPPVPAAPPPVPAAPSSVVSTTGNGGKNDGLFGKKSIKKATTLLAPMVIAKGLESAGEIRDHIYNKSLEPKMQAIESARDSITASENTRVANEEKRKQEAEQLERLKELQSVKYKSVDQKKEAQSITDTLNRRYKNMNLSFDSGSGGIQGLEKAQGALVSSQV